MREIINKIGDERVAAMVTMIVIPLVIWVTFPLLKLLWRIAFVGTDMFFDTNITGEHHSYFYEFSLWDVPFGLLATVCNPFFIILCLVAFIACALYYYSFKALFTGKFLR